jgi:hypothetical protein
MGNFAQVRAGLAAGPELPQTGVSIESLDRMAQARSDTEAAPAMQEAKRKLFLGFRLE